MCVSVSISVDGSRLDYLTVYCMALQMNIWQGTACAKCCSATWCRGTMPVITSSMNICLDLHWLPVSHPITYKLCLTNAYLENTSYCTTPYLSGLIAHSLPPWSLYSSNTYLLLMRNASQVTSLPAFSISAPHHVLGSWNSLPAHICCIDKVSNVN